MSAPSSSDSDYSGSENHSTPSTAPSSPVQACVEAQLTSPTRVNPPFLNSLPLRPGSRDIVLLLSGPASGTDVTRLLNKAKLISGIQIFNHELRESVKREDGVEYYRTQSDDLEDIYNAPGFENMIVKGQILSRTAALNLFTDSCLRSILSITSTNLTLHILERPPFTFPRPSEVPVNHVYNPTGIPFGVPSLIEFRDLWKAWDLVTLGMIPHKMLHQKPIDLRHKCLFYLGHIPTFVNILLSKLLKEPYTQPKSFTTIFERGIDPHVDDPNHCHNHSEVPERDEDWPALPEILDYRDRIRKRLVDFYSDLESGNRVLTRRIGRTLMMILEHEGFHLETLLYMLIQRVDSDGMGMLPPPGFNPPLWDELVQEWESIPPPVSKTVVLGPETLVIGRDDCETDDLLPELEHDIAGHEFGWDNESPRRSVLVEKFEIDFRPISNGEFYEFWEQDGRDLAMPVSWVCEGGEIKIRTLYGTVSMSVAMGWPVFASYDDLSAYAKLKGGRIPNEYELRMFLDKFNVGYEEGANVAFRNWHPLPATAGGEEYGGRGSNGGVWEWTSTVFDAHEGFVGTSIFAGYSSDFFDTKHQVVLGASYATIPRLADRRTVRNFYQHNYPYPWVAARVAYDI